MILLDIQQGFVYSSAFDPVEAADGAGRVQGEEPTVISSKAYR